MIKLWFCPIFIFYEVKKMLKKVFCVCITLVLTVVFAQNVFAVDILFESRQVAELSRGVLYVESRMMTANGMLDVHAIIVDVSQPYVTLAPVINQHSLGRKDTTQNMLRNAGAIAGINADFFGMAGNYSVHFGLMAREGELIALNPHTNSYNATEFFGTFLLDVYGNAFFRYISSNAWLYVNNVRVFQLFAYNTVGPNVWGPTIIDRHAVSHIGELDARIDDLVTIVVEDGLIQGVALAFDPIETPENGFLIVMPRSYFNTFFHLLTYGAEAHVHFTTDLRVDFSRIEAAIGGGGIIMSGGEEITQVRGAFPGPGGRHPRSVVGVMADGRVIMLTVDGRTHSIGATRAELVSILRRFGVTDAINLDGGGSTTLVTSKRGVGHVVANTVSDGAQRRVINALGVFDNSPIGAPAVVGIRPIVPQAAVNVPLEIEVRIEDVFGNVVSMEEVYDFTFVTDPAAGFWLDGRYVPLRAGEHFIHAQYGNLRGTLSILAYELGEIKSDFQFLMLGVGDTTNLPFVGTTVCGRQISIPHLAGFAVSPPHLGYFEGGYFFATGEGSGHITAQAGTVVTFIPIAIGHAELPARVPDSTVFRDRLWANPGFAGFAGGGSYEFQIPERGSNVSYGVVSWSDFVVVNLPSGRRTIPVEYWGRFPHGIRSAGARNVVVMLEESPHDFDAYMEYELFHRAMVELAEIGMRVFVVSRTADTTESAVRDDVRYINFPTGTSAIRFWTRDNEILWG